MAAFGAVAALGWPGAPNECLLAGDCYCEAPRPGLVRQPANTWSCLVGVAVAMLVAWHTGRLHGGSGGHRPTSFMASDRFYAALYSVILLYSAVAPMFFHASLTNWGGKLDMASMYLSFGFWIFFNAARLYGLPRATFLALWLSVTALLLVPRVFFDTLGFPIFAGLVVAVILSEVALSLRDRSPGSDPAAACGSAEAGSGSRSRSTCPRSQSGAARSPESRSATPPPCCRATRSGTC
jgi:hypothetical protein